MNTYPKYVDGEVHTHKLQMCRCAVPNAHGSRSLVPVEMIELELINFLAAMDAVHDVQRAIGVLKCKDRSAAVNSHARTGKDRGDGPCQRAARR